MFFDSFNSIKEIFILTISVYFSLLSILRISGKRTIVELNSFDIVVSITTGSMRFDFMNKYLKSNPPFYIIRENL